MKPEFVTLSFGIGALLLAATHAFGQTGPNCGPRDQVVARLASEYGESRRSIGLAANNRVMEVFAADDTGTWTITVTLPDGMMCLVATGQAFHAFDGADSAGETAL